MFNYGNYCLNIRSNIKNYDSEIEKFINWISPYIITNGFLGYMRYEEFDMPYLIYNDFGKIKLLSIDKFEIDDTFFLR